MRADASASLMSDSTLALVGLTRTAMIFAVGTNSCSSSNRFGPSPAFHDVTPVGPPPSDPLAVHAQQAAVPVIGFLGTEPPDLFADRFRAIRQV